LRRGPQVCSLKGLDEGGLAKGMKMSEKYFGKGLQPGKSGMKPGLRRKMFRLPKKKRLKA
jgi:hypothetical protein